MKSTTSSLEPGIVSVFRLLLTIRLGMLLISAVTIILTGDMPDNPPLFRLIGLVDTAILVGYLSWPLLQKKLGKFYLPIAIGVAVLGPLIENQIFVLRYHALGNPMLAAGAWEMLPILFIPIVACAWQYPFRYVLLLNTLITGINFGMGYYYLQDSTPEMVVPIIAPIFMQFVVFLVVGYMITRLQITQRQQRAELQAANIRLMQTAMTSEQLTVSRERNRMARELHDILAHTLSGVAVELEAVRSLWETNPSQAHQMLDHSLAATRSGLTETRRALQALRASPLEDLGLQLALCELAQSEARRSGLKVEMNIEELPVKYPADVEQCFYRVAQETLSNINQHSAADLFYIRLNRLENHLQLEIGDNGRGFDPQTVDPQYRFGLQGMRERAEMVGAQLIVHSSPGQGTQIRLMYEEPA